MYLFQKVLAVLKSYEYFKLPPSSEVIIISKTTDTSINIFQFSLLLNVYLFCVEMGKILVIGIKEMKLFLIPVPAKKKEGKQV